jgi:drug/metabolite transporter (DMT)-like permease
MYVVSRLAFADVPPATLGLARLAVGLAALVLALRSLPALRDRRLAALGLVLATTLILQFWGTDLAGAAAGSLLTLTTPVFVAILAPLLLGERTTAGQVVGIAVALAGAVLVTGLNPVRSWLGGALLVLSGLTWALFTVYGAGPVRERGALVVTAGASAWAIPFMVPASAVELGLGLGLHLHLGWQAWLAILYLGLGATALAWWAWYRGVEKLPAATASVAFLLQPVVGVALSIPVFGVSPSAGFWAGSGLVAAGVLLSGWRR